MSDNTCNKGPEPLESFSREDEIDLGELLSVIWSGKWLILISAFLFSVIAFLYAMNQPNVYMSEALLSPVGQEQSGGLGGLQNQLGGLASLAGVSLGGGADSKTQLAIQILKSRHFVSEFIDKRNILIDLMAADGWNLSNNTLNYDPELYDESRELWVREVSPPFATKPSMQEAYKVFIELTNVRVDKETGMVNLSVQHVSPFIAQKWVSWLVEDINQAMKIRDVTEAEQSTAFLMSQLEQTKIADIREVLYKLVEEQAKTIMFANVREEYVFKTIDPALVPEQKFGPKRTVMSILGGMLGGMLGVMFVVVRYFKNK